MVTATVSRHFRIAVSYRGFPAYFVAQIQRRVSHLGSQTAIHGRD